MTNPVKDAIHSPRFRTRELRIAEYKRLLWIIIGALVYAFFMNNFLVPMNLYSGGFMGTSQIIRTLTRELFGLGTSSFDYAGIINFCFNIPLYVIAYKTFSKMYMFRGVVFMISQTLFLTLIPVRGTPVIADVLACAIIGGAGCGLGGGLVLRNGANAGGMDMVGSLLIRKYQNLSISIISNTVNIFVFGTMLFLFGSEKVVYSAIQSFCYSLVTDKVFIQNITTEVHIIVDEENVKLVSDAILKKINRGVTRWEGVGGYTGASKAVLYAIVSKYEIPSLVLMVREIDHHAMIVENVGVRINGNFQKRLE